MATNARQPRRPVISAPTRRAGHPDAFPRYTAAKRAAAATLDTASALELVEGQAIPAVATRERRYRHALAIADATAAVGAVVATMALVGGYTLAPLVLLVVPLIIFVAKTQGLYDRDELVIRKSTLNEFPRLVNLATLFALLTWLARHYVVSGNPGTIYLLALWLTLIASLTAARAIGRFVAQRRSPVERCLLVGNGTVERRLAPKLEDMAHVELVGTVAVDEVVNDPTAMRHAAALFGAHRVLIALSDHTDPEETMDVVREAMASGLSVSLLPSSLGAVGSSVAFDDLGGVPLLGVPRFGLSRSSKAIKRAFDLAGAAVVLAFAAPLIGLIALLIKRDSPGPVLFRQTRVGRDGQHFTMLKFRTMVDGADAMKRHLRDANEADGGLFKIENDPRITRVGRLLRKTSLDELPQIFNVLRGDMSLVGPRPLVCDEDERVTGHDRRRLHLTPGMTGRWQTLGSARIPLNEMVKIDYLYVANWSLWADLKIMLETVGFIARRRGL
jgi:exopolysaccharide biosynthesis polyprenyl glycosylphosphotransferase